MDLLMCIFCAFGGYLINFLFKYGSFPNLSLDRNRRYIETHRDHLQEVLFLLRNVKEIHLYQVSDSGYKQSLCHIKWNRK